MYGMSFVRATMVGNRSATAGRAELACPWPANASLRDRSMVDVADDLVINAAVSEPLQFQI